jgi:hypothetical protein
MSELKVHKAYNRWIDEEMPTPNDDLICNEFYLKSEADKVIAELKEKHKTEVKELLCLIRDKDNNFNHAFDSEEKELRHHKYKRCLAMAKLCHWKMGVFIYKKEKSNYYYKWYKRWLKIAEKFMEAE